MYTVQGHPELMSKVKLFARALIFTKSGFSGVFWGEKYRQMYPPSDKKLRLSDMQN